MSGREAQLSLQTAFCAEFLTVTGFPSLTNAQFLQGTYLGFESRFQLLMRIVC